jgi:transposase
LTTKNHLVCDGKGRARVHPHARASGGHQHADRDAERDPRPGRERQAAVEAGAGARGQGYPSKANRAWLRERGIAATIPERDDQIAHRRKRRGRPIDFGQEQRVRYRGRNVVERCFNKLKQWRGIAMRSDKTARNYHAGSASPRHSTGSPAAFTEHRRRRLHPRSSASIVPGGIATPSSFCAAPNR